MENTYLISFKECCQKYRIEKKFVDALESHGLLSPTIIDNEKFFETEHLKELERFITLHYELEVNLEGMEIISRLLHQIENMQEKIQWLENRIHT